MCRVVHRVTIVESFNLSLFAGGTNMDGLRFGESLDDPAAFTAQLREATKVFTDSLDVLADLLGIELDDHRCEIDFAVAQHVLDLPGRFIAAGTVAEILIMAVLVVNAMVAVCVARPGIVTYRDYRSLLHAAG